MTHSLVFQASGSAFRPSAAGLQFTQAFESGSIATFGGSCGSVVPFGAALYALPDLARRAHESDFRAVLAHLQSLLPALRKAGATEFILHLGRDFALECNEEFTREELRMLASLDCHLFYQARRAPEGET